MRLAEEFGRTHGRELADARRYAEFCAGRRSAPAQGRNPFDFNSLISRRAISDDPSTVTEIATPMCADLRRSVSEPPSSIFPAWAGFRTDTHHFRADLDTPLPELEASDWIPFRQVLARSNAV